MTGHGAIDIPTCPVTLKVQDSVLFFECDTDPWQPAYLTLGWGKGGWVRGGRLLTTVTFCDGVLSVFPSGVEAVCSFVAGRGGGGGGAHFLIILDFHKLLSVLLFTGSGRGRGEGAVVRTS